MAPRPRRVYPSALDAAAFRFDSDSRRVPRSRKLKAVPGNWKLTLAYDGTGFSGWQIQPGRETVQGNLAEAIRSMTGEEVLPQGSGRTDAGVHALAQVASVVLAAPIPPANLRRALNRALPPSIRVLAAEPAPDGFHARHSAISKSYEYRVYRREICPPWLAPFVYPLPWPLDTAAFAASAPDAAARAEPRAASNIRQIHASAWTIEPTGERTSEEPRTRGQAREEAAGEGTGSAGSQAANLQAQDAGALLVYHVQGSGFLHHMVRNLVGTFMEVGRGQIAADILAARARPAAGPTAPARGLFLHSVQY